MSYDNASSGKLDRNNSSTAPCPQISMGWFRMVSYAGTNYEFLGNFSVNGANSAIQTDATTGTTITGTTQFQSGPVTIATGSSTVWIFICRVLVQSGPPGMQLYWRLEGETSLSSGFIADNGMLDTNDEVRLLNGGSPGSGGPSHMRCTAYKEWSLSSSLTSAQILAESQQNAPIVSTALTNYLSCALGSTVGQDQSGNASDWTVTGTIVTNAEEPNMSTGSTPTVPGSTRVAPHVVLGNGVRICA